jgi:hypothetical protein
MLRRVAFDGSEVSDERSASIIRVTRFGELGTTLALIATEVSYEEILCASVGDDRSATFPRNVGYFKSYAA